METCLLTSEATSSTWRTCWGRPSASRKKPEAPPHLRSARMAAPNLLSNHLPPRAAPRRSFIPQISQAPPLQAGASRFVLFFPESLVNNNPLLCASHVAVWLVVHPENEELPPRPFATQTLIPFSGERSPGLRQGPPKGPSTRGPTAQHSEPGRRRRRPAWGTQRESLFSSPE